MEEKDKLSYAKRSEAEKELYERLRAEWLRTGEFTFEDGTKSRDPKNLHRVVKLQGSVPPALSAYILFCKDQKVKPGTKGKEMVLQKAQLWKDANAKTRKKYEELAAKETALHKKRQESVWINGYWLDEHGNKNGQAPVLTKRVTRAQSRLESSDACQTKRRRSVSQRKSDVSKKVEIVVKRPKTGPKTKAK